MPLVAPARYAPKYAGRPSPRALDAGAHPPSAGVIAEMEQMQGAYAKIRDLSAPAVEEDDAPLVQVIHLAAPFGAMPSPRASRDITSLLLPALEDCWIVPMGNLYDPDGVDVRLELDLLDA